MTTTIPTRLCTGCGLTKPLARKYFARRDSDPEGYRRQCVECQAASRKASRERHTGKAPPPVARAKVHGEFRPGDVWRWQDGIGATRLLRVSSICPSPNGDGLRVVGSDGGTWFSVRCEVLRERGTLIERRAH